MAAEVVVVTVVEVEWEVEIEVMAVEAEIEVTEAAAEEEAVVTGTDGEIVSSSINNKHPGFNFYYNHHQLISVKE